MDRRLLLLVLPGCFQPYQDLPKLDFSEMSFDRPGLDTNSAVVRAFDLDNHVCPDGEPARVYAVYSESAAENAPVAVVLHSGAFDYIVSYDDGEAPLDGRNYRTESRLERAWALAKVWETLGMLPTAIDAGEENAGTLPIAMVNAGWVQLYPANCWGDLWHYDAAIAPNDADTEGFARDGLGLAMEAVRTITTPGYGGEVGIEIPVSIDPSRLYLVGLGDGGRGVTEVLSHPDMDPADVTAILLDSTPDLASAYVDDPVTWYDEIVGMETIYGEEFAEDPDAISTLALIEAGIVSFPVGLVWTPLDHTIPAGATAPLADAMIAVGAPHLVVENQGAGHVFTNSDPALAEAMVAWLSDGVFPEE